jgi:hypothetical protein
MVVMHYNLTPSPHPLSPSPSPCFARIPPSFAETPAIEDVDQLDRRVVELHAERKYAEALRGAECALALAEASIGQ